MTASKDEPMTCEMSFEDVGGRTLRVARWRLGKPSAHPPLLFFNGKSFLGWLLTAVGAVIILAGVLMHMDIYFRQTSLFNTLVMLGLLFGGLGLVARSLRSS